MHLFDHLLQEYAKATPPRSSLATGDLARFMDWSKGYLRGLPVVGTSIMQDGFSLVLADGSAFAINDVAEVGAAERQQEQGAQPASRPMSDPNNGVFWDKSTVDVMGPPDGR